VDDLKTEYSSLITASSIVYADAQVNGTSVFDYSGRCGDWNTFFAQFGAYSISKDLSALTLITTTSLYSENLKAMSMTNCTNRDRLSELQAFGSSGGSEAVSVVCPSVQGTSNVWSFASCSKSSALCVNCTATSAGAKNLFSPCLKKSNVSCFDGESITSVNLYNKKHSFARLLIATFSTSVPSVGHITGSSTKNSIMVSATLSTTGSLYCMASSANTVLSVQSIVAANNLGKTGAGNNVNVTMTSLTAATEYSIYCVTMSLQGTLSTVASAVANKIVVKTQCCRSVTFALTTKSVFGSSQMGSIAVLSVDGILSEALQVRLVAARNGVRKDIFFPANISFSRLSASIQSIGFIGADLTGWYNISAKLFGNASSNYAVQFSNGNAFKVLASNAAPETPHLSYARMSNDGTAVTLVLDAATDKGANSGSGSMSSVSLFQCSLLFVFTGSASATCQWSSDATSVAIYPNSRYLLSIGSSVSLLNGKLRAACPSTVSAAVCSGWSSVPGANTSVLTPLSPIQPAVTLTLPSSVGSCGSLVLDFGGSTGSGGRTWARVNVSVTSKASNVSVLAAYLSGISAKSPLTLSRSWFQSGFLYAFTVTLCNFMGACGSGTGTVSVLDMVVPYVSIVGGATVTVTANSSLRLSSLAYIESCGGVKSTLNLQYSWSMFQLSNSSDSYSSLSLSSASKDPSKFVLTSYQLSSLASYLVQLTVVDTSSLKSSTVTTTVLVPASSLVVVIAGGSEQCVRLGTGFAVNASGSYDSGVADGGKKSVAYSWQCNRLSPSYSHTCALSLAASSTSASVLTGTVPISAGNSSSLLVLTVSDGGRTATGEVKMVVLSAVAPVVSIVTTQVTNVLASSQLILQASITTTVSCESAWTVDDASIDLTAVSVVSPTKQLNPASTGSESIFAVYLSLLPNSLPVGSTLGFTLACTNADTGLKSYAAVTVVTNSPPTPGSCEITPNSGTALATSFVFVASSWVDSDLPVRYEFGFFSPSSNAILIVQSRSQASSGKSLLPAGASSAKNNITGLFIIFDGLGASITDYVTVTVTAPSAGLNASFLSSVAVTLIASAAGNVDGLKQAISVVSTSLNSVNCSLSPNCSALNRFECAGTAHTCGSCLSSSFVGLSGDSNELCVSLASTSETFGDIGTVCAVDADCGIWRTCDTSSGTCIAAPITCPGNCTASSRHGVCKYVSTTSLASFQTCTMFDANCAAICACSSNWYGPDCSLTLAQYEAKQVAVSQLMIGLYQVNELETLDSQSLTYRANALQSLAGNAFMLSESAAVVAYNISRSLLASSISSSISILSNAEAIVASVNSIVSVKASSRRRRKLTMAQSDEQSMESLIDNLSEALAGQMVSGQSSQSYIQSNYRLIASILSSVDANSSISIPQSALESALGTVESNEVILPYFGSKGQVGITSIPKHLISADNVTSDVFRVTANFGSCDASRLLTFSFVHYDSEFIGLYNSSNVTRSTQCSSNKTETVMVNCSYGISVPVHCDGSSTTEILTICPKPMRQAVCSLSFGTEAVESGSSDHCQVINSSSTVTVCQCNLCAAVTERRKLFSVYDVGGANVAALATTSFTEYASVMESASQFNSLGAVKSTALVIGMFAAMWLGTVLAVLIVELARWRKIQLKDSSSKSRMRQVSPGTKAIATKQPNGLQQSNLEECLRDYISHLFSSAFSNKADIVRLFDEVYQKHKYLSVFTIDAGLKQWIGAYYLLSNRTASFFLLAMFYSIQFPSDDGTCALLTTEATCLSKKSMFDTEDTVCTWTAGSSDTVTGSCAWQSPSFNAYSAVVISVVVLVVAVPIQLLLGQIFKRVLMAPKVGDVEANKASIRSRRSSAILMINDQDKVANIVKSTKTKTTKVFSAVSEMDGSIRKYTVAANQMGYRRFKKSDPHSARTATRDDYRSIDRFLAELRQFDPRKRNLDSVYSGHNAQRRRGRVIDEFGAAWGTLLDEPDTDSAPVHTAVRHELSAVVKEADDLVAKLKAQPSEQVGVQILELFVRDCLGQHTREATIFSQKVYPLRERVVVTWGIKCFTFSCLLILNVYFIFACMLYGRDKGQRWQRGWLYTCLVNLFVDICINQVIMAAVIHYFVPNLIVSKARLIKATITRIIHDICGLDAGKRERSARKRFSASSYFFVSAHVARAFPDLLESRIVTANNSFSLPKDQMVKFNPDYESRRKAEMRFLVSGTRDQSWIEAVGLWVTSLLLLFGSQSVQVQELVINLFNPALVTAIAFVGLGVLHRSFFGIPIGALIIIGTLVVAVIVYKYYTYEFQRVAESEIQMASREEAGLLYDLPGQASGMPVASVLVPVIPGGQSPVRDDFDDSDDDFDMEEDEFELDENPYLYEAEQVGPCNDSKDDFDQRALKTRLHQLLGDGISAVEDDFDNEDDEDDFDDESASETEENQMMTADNQIMDGCGVDCDTSSEIRISLTRKDLASPPPLSVSSAASQSIEFEISSDSSIANKEEYEHQLEGAAHQFYSSAPYLTDEEDDEDDDDDNDS
jgi:hypothetical protein